MISEVTKIFDDFISDTFKDKPDMRKFFMRHPRKSVCLDNLCEQIRGVERSKMSIIFDSRYYKRTIHDVARMFCQQALEHHRQSNLSEAEKHRERAVIDRDQFVEEAVAEMKKDGLIIDNEATLKELSDDGADKAQEEAPGIILEH